MFAINTLYRYIGLSLSYNILCVLSASTVFPMDISCCHIDLCVCVCVYVCVCLKYTLHLTVEAIGQYLAHVWTGKPASLPESSRTFSRFILTYVVLPEIIFIPHPF